MPVTRTPSRTPIVTKLLDTNSNETLITTATASAVNELTLTNAATNNTPSLAATGGDTNIPIDIRGKGTGVVKIGIRSQSDTTDSNQNAVWFQGGWGYFVGNGTASNAETVTFPTAFSTLLGIVMSPIGYKDTTNPSGITDFGDWGILDALPLAPSTSAFTARISTIDASTIANTRRVGYSWLAWGI